MATVTITRDSAELATIAGRKNIIRDDCTRAIFSHAVFVAAELEVIDSLPAAFRSNRSASFAILSPQSDFMPNALATPVLIDALRDDLSSDDTLSALRSVGYKMTNDKKVTQYVRSRDFILGGEAITFALAIAQCGYGQKAACMATALYSQWSEVITLDTWMLNGLLGEANTGGRKNKNTYTAKGPAYHDIEALLLDLAAELDVSPFLLQWSLWNHYRGFSESHLPIFA